MYGHCCIFLPLYAVHIRSKHECNFIIVALCIVSLFSYPSTFTIFVTPHSNVMLAHFSVCVSAPTLLIMNFTKLGQSIACVMQLTTACFPTVETFN